MKSKMVLVAAVTLALLVGLAPAAFSQQYDRDATVKIMRANGAALGALNQAVKAGDFYTAALKLMDLAVGAKAMLAIQPPKGVKADWDRINNDIVLASFRGIGACGTQNLEALKAEVAAVLALNKEGHTKFR